MSISGASADLLRFASKPLAEKNFWLAKKKEAKKKV